MLKSIYIEIICSIYYSLIYDKIKFNFEKFEKGNLIMSSNHLVQRHPYHLVDPSPWPLIGSISALLLTTGGVM